MKNNRQEIKAFPGGSIPPLAFTRNGIKIYGGFYYEQRRIKEIAESS